MILMCWNLRSKTSRQLHDARASFIHAIALYKINARLPNSETRKRAPRTWKPSPTGDLTIKVMPFGDQKSLLMFVDAFRCILAGRGISVCPFNGQALCNLVSCVTNDNIFKQFEHWSFKCSKDSGFYSIYVSQLHRAIYFFSWGQKSYDFICVMSITSLLHMKALHMKLLIWYTHKPYLYQYNNKMLNIIYACKYLTKFLIYTTYFSKLLWMPCP